MFIEFIRQLIAEHSLPPIKSRPVDPCQGILRELLSHKHPERREGEVFLGYWTPAAAAAIPWKTKRIGACAYDDHGKPYPAYLLRDVTGVPVFANAIEVVQGMRHTIWGI